MVTVFIPQALRSYSQGKDRVDVPGGGSLRQVFEKLDVECPGLKSQLMAEDEDDVRPGLAIFINDEMAAQGLVQRVPDDGSILILPAIGGGALLRIAFRKAGVQRAQPGACPERGRRDSELEGCPLNTFPITRAADKPSGAGCAARGHA